MTHTEAPPTGAAAGARGRLPESRLTLGRRVVFVVLVVTLAASFHAYRHPRAPFYGDGKAHVVIEKMRICDILPARVKGSEVFSKDLARCAYEVERSGKKAIVIDGVEGPPFSKAGEWWELSPSTIHPGYNDAIRYRIQFSYDGRHAAYIAKQDGKYCVVYDGVQGPFYDGAGSSLGRDRGKQWMYYTRDICISGDSQHWGYPATKGERQLMVIDGVEGAEFDEVLARRYGLWSADGEHSAYTARLGDKWLVVYDGSAGNLYDEVNPYGLEWSDDSDHFAFYGRAGDKWRYVIDGVEGKWYDYVEDFHFGRDGGAAYVATVGGESFIVSNGVEGPRHDSVTLFEVDDTGGPVLYWAQDGRRAFVMDHGTARPGYDSVSEACFAYGRPESCTASIYEAHKGEKSCIVVDGVEGKWYDSTGNVYVSPDGKRVAYDAQKSESGTFVVDGVEYGACYYVDDFSFSGDSRHFVYEAGHSNTRVEKLADRLDDWLGISIPTPERRTWTTIEADGRAIGEYEKVRGLSFTADGRHVFHVARLDGEDFIFIDGQKASDAMIIFDGYRVWRDGDVLMWLTRKNNAWWRVRATIVSD